MSPKVGMRGLRREQIVRATVRCLAREGYTRLTLKKVAREAGVSQGILHYYFADKRAILVATLEAVSRDLDRRVAAAQSRTGRDPAGCARSCGPAWRLPCAAPSSGWSFSSSGAR